MDTAMDTAWIFGQVRAAVEDAGHLWRAPRDIGDGWGETYAWADETGDLALVIHWLEEADAYSLATADEETHLTFDLDEACDWLVMRWPAEVGDA